MLMEDKGRLGSIAETDQIIHHTSSVSETVFISPGRSRWIKSRKASSTAQVAVIPT